ncbi:Helix-turn-helix [Tissierella praeacuta DSM 18095]|uniref:Helix-turn-helix n=1 Tax=Tissierella praeacuta DSM 18095 TaxID=1123404 RepID=A0A1M4WF85_9FIRM|nr:helix-turn-helix transcriptional regulator [Tissierella praeacuta]SHE79855.1 Helix-turn-helix [Tissierella praeacuta DSM 18095]SUO99485.1 HTH-type transcriptional regulator immR [Tissierella praeacuta]
MKEILKHLRQEREITQRELAKKLNISPSTIAMYETGQRKPDSDMLENIANFFNVSVDYLLGRTDIKNPSEEISNAVENDPELLDFWNELKEREDLQVLFKQTKELTPKGIQQIIRIIKAIEDEEDREN